MNKIYEIPLEKNKDIISYSSLSHIIREIWFLFDSSVLVRFSNFFMDRKKISFELKDSFIKLVALLSHNNINIHYLPLFEAAKGPESFKLPLNRELGIKHIHALLIAQCIDLEHFNFDEREWRISKKREKFIIDAHQKGGNNLEELAKIMYDELVKGELQAFLNGLKSFNEECVFPYLNSLRNANLEGGSNVEKLEIFFSGLKNTRYCPKIADYCMRVLLLSHKEPLLKGALRKIKTEIENTAIDFALFEMASLSNFREPFTDIKPMVNFFTCDNNLYYYANLGHPLVINLPNLNEHIYYPDMSYIAHDKKIITLAKDFFKMSNLNDIKDLVIAEVNKEINKIGWTKKNIEVFNEIKNIDLSDLIVYKYYNEIAQ